MMPALSNHVPGFVREFGTVRSTRSNNVLQQANCRKPTPVREKNLFCKNLISMDQRILEIAPAGNS